MVYEYEYPRPSVTLDAAVLRTPALEYPEILLIKRGNAPFSGFWALPGGFMEMDETPLFGASRELSEETALYDLPLKPLFGCAEPGRDPRGRTVTFVFGCLIRDTNTRPKSGDDAAEVAWFPLNKLPKMAFDHKTVIAQIEQSLLWQAKHLIIGQDVFHDLASGKDIKRLHNNILNEKHTKILDTAENKGLLKCKEGICEYIKPVPSGPDWHPMPW